MLYNFAADSFHTKKLCNRLSSTEVRIYRENGRFAFVSPPLGDLGATYYDHLRLVGKHVVDFLLVLIELFSLDRTAEALRAIIGSKMAISLQRGPVDPKFLVEGVAPTNHSHSQKTRINVLSYDIKTEHCFLPFCQMHSFDRRADRRTDRQNSHRKTVPAFHAAR